MATAVASPLWIIAIQHTIDTDWSGIESKQKFEQLHIVLGVVNDKDLEEILPLFPKNAIYYFSQSQIIQED
jgi:hypothetical protein